jgi:hypothetical protein
VISVDGAFGAPGLNLSHWPGNTTPPEFKHDLSTGSALKFAKLPLEERERLVEGCVEICNNHVDTDGVCAMFAVARPELALEHEERLLAAAEAGDFFRPKDENALILDTIVTACLDSERSPWLDRTRDLSENERHEFDVRELVERLPALLAGEIDEYADLWKPVIEDWHADCADLAEASLDDLAHLDFAVWTASEGESSSRTNASSEHFDPSRQALFSKHFADRVLVVSPTSSGTAYRFLLSTLSWFDQEGRPCLARPELARLASTLNELEGTDPEQDESAWHAHKQAGASPELWFGVEGLPSYPTHATPYLRRSRLEPHVVRLRVLDALRETWVFPE